MYAIYLPTYLRYIQEQYEKTIRNNKPVPELYHNNNNII